MGKERKYPISEVSKVIEMVITHGFIDFKTEGIFAHEPDAASIVKLKEILAEINWKKMHVKQTAEHQKQLILDSSEPDSKKKDKEKEKPKSDTVAQDDPSPQECVLHHIVRQIEAFNDKLSPSHRINSHTWASICKDLIQNGAIFNRFSKHELAARGILFDEMRKAYRSLDVEELSHELEKSKSLVEGETPWVSIDVKLNPRRTEQMILQFLGQLCKRGNRLKKSAQVIHNYFHLGYLIFSYESYNGFDSKMAAMLLTPSFLDGIGFSGILIPTAGNTENKVFNVKELLPLKQFIKIFIETPIFRELFNAEEYKEYCQPQAVYKEKLESCAKAYDRCQMVLWNSVIEHDDIAETKLSEEKEAMEDVAPEEDLQKTKKRVPSLFGMLKRRPSNRDLPPAPISPRSAKETDTQKASPKKGSPRKSEEAESQAQKVSPKAKEPSPRKSQQGVTNTPKGKPHSELNDPAKTYTPANAQDKKARRRSAFLAQRESNSDEAKVWQSFQGIPTELKGMNKEFKRMNEEFKGMAIEEPRRSGSRIMAVPVRILPTEPGVQRGYILMQQNASASDDSGDGSLGSSASEPPITPRKESLSLSEELAEMGEPEKGESKEGKVAAIKRQYERSSSKRNLGL